MAILPSTPRRRRTWSAIASPGTPEIITPTVRGVPLTLSVTGAYTPVPVSPVWAIVNGVESCGSDALIAARAAAARVGSESVSRPRNWRRPAVLG